MNALNRTLTLTLTFLSLLFVETSPVRAAFPQPGDWKPVAPSPAPTHLKGIAHGGGKWIAVGDFGRIASSTDGLNWTVRESSAPKDWNVSATTGHEIRSVAHGDGKWRACGSGGRVYSSDDGIVWTNKVIYEADANLLQAIRYADGRWVIAGGQGEIHTSTDGESWQKVPIAGAERISGLGRGNGQWVGADISGDLYTSTTGLSWSKTGSVHAESNRGVTDIHFGNGLWVAVTDKPRTVGAGKIFSSPDLVTWTERHEVPIMSLYSVAFADGLWVTSGGLLGVNDPPFDGPYEGGAVLTSPDGITWTRQALPRNTLVWGVAYGDGRWVGASSGHGGLAHSENGTEWRNHEAYTPVAIPKIQNAAYHNGLWIATLRDGVVLRSTDGQHWSSSVLDSAKIPDWLQDVLYSERLGKWFIGGDFGKVWSSPDGLQWELHNIGTGGTEAMIEGGGKILCAGRNWDLYTTEDGETWREVDHPLKGVSSGRFLAAAYGNETWVVGGSGGVVLRSADGVSWSRSTIAGAAQLEDFHFHNNLWVACDDRGSVYWSTNLQQWTKGALPAATHPRILKNVDYLGETWIVCGTTDWDEGHVYTSHDGKSWTRQAPFFFPAGGVEQILKVEDDWWAFGRTLEMGFVMSTKDYPVAENPDRSLIFSDGGSYTVTDTNEPEQFTSLALEETLGGAGETLYVAFKIKRESGFGAQLDFTALQLSRSATNLPIHGDLGFGNGGPTTFYGIIVEPNHTDWPDKQIPLDNDTHTIIARIDYGAGTVSMVTDPQSPSDIENATRHEAPTNPFSAIMLRAGHNDTSYTYSRIALGESVEAVLEFTEEEGAPTPNANLDPGNFREWEWKNPVLSSETFEDVAYGGGRYVAVGRAARIIWSDDGLSWQPAEELPEKGEDLYAVAYGGGRWVAAGFRTVYTSTDGVHWEDLEQFRSKDIDDVAFHNTRWVMVGDGVYTSRNGTIWEMLPEITEGFLTGVGYGDALWVTASIEGEVLTSSDGVTWTQRRAAPAEREWIQRVRYYDGYWLLPGEDRVITSQGGMTWTPRPVGDPDTVNLLSDVIPVGDGRWLAVGWQRVVTDDPESWPMSESPDQKMRAAVRGSDGRVILVGDEGAVHTTMALEAWADGHSSALQAIGPGGDTDETGRIADLAYGNGVWLASSPADGLTTRLWRSTDGDEYTIVPSPTPDAYLLSLSYGEGEFLATTFRGKIFTSADGLAWEERERPSGGVVLQGSHIADGQRVIVGGLEIFYGPANSSEAFKQASEGSDIPLHDVTYGNGTWVAVGAGGTVLTASDPDRWEVENVQVLGNAFLEKVSFANGRFFIGTEGVTVTSTDGKNWTQTTHALFDDEVVTGVVYHEANGKWYSCSYSSGSAWLYESEDGVDWNFLIGISRRAHRHLVYADGQLVVAGESGQIIAHGTPVIDPGADPDPGPDPTAFETWMKANSITDPLARLDGRTALETYAQAIDLGPPSIGANTTAGQRTVYFARVRQDLEGIRVMGEYSTDMENWIALTETPDQAQVGPDLVEHSWFVDKDPSRRGYFRLKLSLEE